MAKGIYQTKKKNGDIYYRVSITHKGRHISLGSSADKDIAEKRYVLAKKVLDRKLFNLDDYSKTDQSLDYEKWIIIMNFRDNGLYFKTPIYLSKNYFTYHIDMNRILIFDVDDLFFYSSHKIFAKGNYLFVNDYGMQTNILSRYGIRNYASYGKDYLFIDGNRNNFRYENIKIRNPYLGVEQVVRNGSFVYKAKIHLKGYVTIGHYKSIHKAAVAYNKAVDFMLRYITPDKNYSKNYIEAISKEEAEYYYTSIKLPEYLINLVSFDEQIRIYNK